MRTKCKSCGAIAVEEDDGLTCCKNCGLMVEDKDILQNDPLQELGPNQSKACNKYTPVAIKRNYVDTKLSTGKKVGIQFAEMLAGNYKFNKDMKQEYIKIYRNLLMDSMFYNTIVSTKKILASVCAYIIMTRHSWYIPIIQLCKIGTCSKAEFSSVYMSIQKKFPHLKIAGTTIEELVPSILNEHDFTSKEKYDLEKRIVELLCIIKEFIQFEGRSPVYLIKASLFFAWKSLKPYERRKINVSSFCQILGIETNQTLCQRIKELTTTFINLANKIPGIRIKLTKNNISLYISDIIEFQDLLIKNLKKDTYSESDLKINNPDEYTIGEVINSLNEARKTFETCGAENSYQDSNLSDISDSEVDHYILSDEQVRIKKKIRRMSENIPDLI